MLATHPPTSERIALIQGWISQNPPSASLGVTSTAFQAVKARLPK